MGKFIIVREWSQGLNLCYNLAVEYIIFSCLNHYLVQNMVNQ